LSSAIHLNLQSRVDKYLRGTFGIAGDNIVIEEFLEGEEAVFLH